MWIFGLDRSVGQRPILVRSGPFDPKVAGGDKNFVNVLSVPDLDPVENIAIQFRFLDSLIPQGAGGVSPAVDGLLRFSRAGDLLGIDGVLYMYPSMEIIRDGRQGPNLVYSYTQQGGPLVGLSKTRSISLTCGLYEC